MSDPAIMATADVIAAEGGLHIVHVPNNLPLIMVRRALEQAVGHGKSAYGFSFQNKKKLISFLSISKNQQEQANAFYKSCSPEDENQQTIIPLGRNCFDFFSSEGLLYLKTKLAKRNGMVCTCQQSVYSTLLPGQVESLIMLQQYVKRKDICFILFAQSEATPESIGCIELADEYLLLGRCEPYIGSVASFSVDPLNRRWLSGSVAGNVHMATIWEMNGKLTLKHDSFVSEKLQTRLIWMMKQYVFTGEQVSSATNKHRSTVWRVINGVYVPPPHILPPPEFITWQNKLLAGDDCADEPYDDYLS